MPGIFTRCRQRSRYIARFIYWVIQHRSLRNVSWVLEFEGITWDPTAMNTHKNASAEEQLLADLVTSFPGIFARPLREFGAAGWEHGVWTGGEALMPDGLPMFSSLLYGEETHDGGIHTGLLAWLQARGWYIETYDEGVHFIVPIAATEGLAG